jgi:predicted enzyme related to lactoylglutathione lyase
LLPRLAEAKTVKNRVHLDLHVGADQRDAVVRRLTGAGGTVIGQGQGSGSSWIVMADPEGNEFCVA